MNRHVIVVLAAGLAMPGCAESPPESVLFEAAFPEIFAGGGAITDAWADFDGDGLPDRFVGFNGTPSRLYHNGRTTFTDVASDMGLSVERSVRTAAWGDFDDDGYPDLLLGFAGDAPVTALYRNDGGARFQNVAAEVGLEIDEGVTRQASWIDVDGDGDLDLFLAMRDRANRLFDNRGADGFVDVTEESGIGDTRRTVGAVWFDLGGGRLDVLVANMNGDANGLLEQGPAGFAPWSGESTIHGGGRAVGDDAQGSVRPCVVDFDADGAFDLFFANYGPNGLFRRTGDDATPFVNVAADVGLAIDSRYDTCAWADVDHDGTVDLYVNGTVGGGQHYRDWLLRREGGSDFVDATPPALLALNASHGANWVDFDMDGDMDLALAGVAEDGTFALMRNLLRPEIRRLGFHVRVLDAEGHATRSGAEVRVYAAGSERLLGTRLVDTGSAYDAQSDLPVHFGLPGGQPVDVEVTILVGDRRITATQRDVDPTLHAERPLRLEIDDDGRIVSAGS